MSVQLTDREKQRIANAVQAARGSLRDSNDPIPEFEQLIVSRLREMDVDIQNSNLRVDYPGDIDAGIRLIERQGTYNLLTQAADMFANRSGVAHNPYWKQLRESLRQVRVANIPQSPENPETMFEQILVSRLREFDVEIIDRSELKITYPEDIDKARLLVERQGNQQPQANAAENFAQSSNAQFKLYRKQIRASLQQARIPNIPQSPDNPESLFEKVLVQRLREFDVDMSDRSKLRIEYPDDIDKARILVERQGTTPQQEDAAGQFAQCSSAAHKMPRLEPDVLVLVESADEYIRYAAMNAFSLMRNDSLRNLAIKMLDEGNMKPWRFLRIITVTVILLLSNPV